MQSCLGVWGGIRAIKAEPSRFLNAGLAHAASSGPRCGVAIAVALVESRVTSSECTFIHQGCERVAHLVHISFDMSCPAVSRWMKAEVQVEMGVDPHDRCESGLPFPILFRRLRSHYGACATPPTKLSPNALTNPIQSVSPCLQGWP